jgi:hypothetical protein
MMKVVFVNRFTNKEHEVMCEKSYLDYFMNLEHISIISVTNINEAGGK